MIFKVVNKQLRRDDELRLNFRRDSSSLFVSKSMARQIPSKSKHRIMAEKPARRSRSSTTRTTTTSSTRSSNTRGTTTSSTRTSTTPIVSHGVQARGRLEHQEDNSAVESLPRVLDGLGSLQGSIETSLESTSLESTVSVRFFLILVSLFYVEVSVTRPVFHIWYCTRGFLFRLKIVLPPS